MKRCLVLGAWCLVLGAWCLELGVRCLVLALVVAAFCGVPLCWISLKAQGLVWGVLATLLLGRFFCNAICPLGIAQSFVNWLCHPKSHARRVCTRLPESNAQRIVRWSVVVLLVALGVAGFTGPAMGLTPISIFGKAVAAVRALAVDPTQPKAFTVFALATFAFVLVLAACGKGRFWCNWICPFGTVYSLVARICLVKNKVGPGCGNCRKCMGEGMRDEGRGKREEGRGKRSGVESGATRREALKGVAVLAVADKLTDGGLAGVSLPGVPERGVPVLPPGAGSLRAFSLKCAACQLCVANCPGGCLKPSLTPSRFGQPELNFQHGHCIATCVKCGEVCPEGAIMKLQDVLRKNVHMGHAEWRRDLCVRTVEKVECTACVRKCPVRAIHLVAGYPVVDRDACIGCGACEHVCPARPMPAIFVKGHEEQRIVKPISEADLLAEMKKLVDAGKACVIAKDGVIVRQLEGRGVKPIVDELDRDPKAFAGVVAYDKVIGRAAAAVYVVGGAAKVAADVMSEAAVAFLEKHGVAAVAAKKVPQIINRAKTGICPMEATVANLDNPEEMVNALRKAIAK